MAADPIQCTHCKAVMTPANPIPAGTKVKCPKCGKPFVVGASSAKPENTAPKMPTTETPADDNPFAVDAGDTPTMRKARQRSYMMPIVVMAVFVLGSCCCCGGGGGWWYYENHVKVAPAKKEEEKKKKKGDPDHVISDNRRFAEEVTGDRDAAKQKYEGKLIEITGEFEEIRRLGKDHKPGVIMGVDGLWVLEFTLKSTETGKAFRMPRAQKVKMVATYQGLRDNTFLMFDAAVLTDLDPGKKIVEVTGEELVAEFQKDSKLADERFRKDIIVTGEVLGFKRDELNGSIAVTMKGSKNMPLTLFYDGEDTREGQRLTRAKSATLRTNRVRLDGPNGVAIQAPLVVETK